MAWTAKFTCDTDNENIGTCSAVNDETGVSYSRRLDKSSDKDIAGFVEECHSQDNQAAVDKTECDKICAMIEEKLNG